MLRPGAAGQDHSSVVGMVPLSRRPASWRQSARPCCRQGYHRRALQAIVFELVLPPQLPVPAYRTQ